MRIKLSLSEVVLAAAVIGVIAYTTNWGTEAMMRLRALFPRAAQSAEAPKAEAPRLTPLAQQIPLCRKERSGFQPCMFRAGYQVNPAWTSAHNADRQGPSGTLDFGRAGELVNDQFRAGPSPAYGVPYWTPRPPPQ